VGVVAGAVADAPPQRHHLAQNAAIVELQLHHPAVLAAAVLSAAAPVAARWAGAIMGASCRLLLKVSAAPRSRMPVGHQVLQGGVCMVTNSQVFLDLSLFCCDFSTEQHGLEQACF
jgi:hypothetical protein